jgi:antitoxin ParD1/3/4
MSVTLTPQVEDQIRRLMETGQYPDADSVVRDALRLLEGHRNKIDALRAKLQVGIDQLERGESVEVTPEFWEELDRDVDEALRRGDLPDPDVCP